eukprot:12855716-Alexandrium_andersonii.AAC.1
MRVPAPPPPRAGASYPRQIPHDPTPATPETCHANRPVSTNDLWHGGALLLLLARPWKAILRLFHGGKDVVASKLLVGQ